MKQEISEKKLMIKKRFANIVIFIGISLVGLISCTSAQTDISSDQLTAIPPLTKMDIDNVESLPDFLVAISPPANYMIPLDLYNYYPEGQVSGIAVNYDQNDMSPLKDGFDSKICVRPLMENLVQQGDFFVEEHDNGEKLSDRITFIVDGESVKMKPFENGGNIIVLTASPTNPRSMWAENVSYCWDVQLDTGVHEITFSFQQTTGEDKSFMWFYEIIE